MPQIITYPVKGVLDGQEQVVGSDITDSDITKQFITQDIADLSALAVPSFSLFRQPLLGPNFATIHSSPAAPGVNFDFGGTTSVINNPGPGVAFAAVSVSFWTIRQGAGSGNMNIWVRDYDNNQNIIQMVGSVASNIENIQDRWIPVSFTFYDQILSGQSRQYGTRVTDFSEEVDLSDPFISAQVIFFP